MTLAGAQCVGTRHEGERYRGENALGVDIQKERRRRRPQCLEDVLFLHPRLAEEARVERKARETLDRKRRGPRLGAGGRVPTLSANTLKLVDVSAAAFADAEMVDARGGFAIGSPNQPTNHLRKQDRSHLTAGNSRDST